MMAIPRRRRLAENQGTQEVTKSTKSTEKGSILGDRRDSTMNTRTISLRAAKRRESDGIAINDGLVRNDEKSSRKLSSFVGKCHAVCHCEHRRYTIEAYSSPF
jgi:hypothetical protein